MAEAAKAPLIQKAPAWKLMRALTLIAAVTGFLIVLTYQWTLPIITKNKAEALKKAIFRMRPATRQIGYFLVADEKLLSVQEKRQKGKILYAGYNDSGSLTGVWAEAAGIGYQDKIRLLFALNPPAANDHRYDDPGEQGNPGAWRPNRKGCALPG